jgi:deoxycytidine triphosphate deaminase
MQEIDISEEPFMLDPKRVCLAHSVELFYLPLDITAEYRLKSSLARAFLEHLTAVWCDPGWHGSSLTLELSNMTEFHRIPLSFGMKCGQVSFRRHAPVPEEKSYRLRGKYNETLSVSQSKGVT